MLKPRSGSVVLDGAVISTLPTKQVARRLGLLPQSSSRPTDHGRGPRLPRPPPPPAAPAPVVAGRRPGRPEAMDQTAVDDLADRLVDELSGGQRQRVCSPWRSPRDAPPPPRRADHLPRHRPPDGGARPLRGAPPGGRTLVAVLHDLNQRPVRYPRRGHAGRDVFAEGPPAEIVDAELVEAVFGLPCLVVPVPRAAHPWWCPQAARRGARLDAPRASPTGASYAMRRPRRSSSVG